MRHLLTLLSITALSASTLLAAERRPNIVLFFIDDLGYADLGCYGSEFYETPHLDKLAKAGVKFTASYSANPVCSPTRAALMSGKAPQRVGITQWIHQPSDKHLPLEEITVGEAFQEAGYATCYIGKWHLGEKDSQMPNKQGFDTMIATNRAGQPASYFFPYSKKSKRGTYWNVPDLEDGEEGDYLTDKVTDKAMNYIAAHKEKPFFMCFSHYAVHTPIRSPDKLVKKYRAKVTQQFGDKKLGPIKEKYNSVSRPRQDSATYAAMIENLDTNVGRLLAKLEELKLTSDTIVVFTSDNGGHCHLKRSPGYTSNLPLRSGKGWTYEGGIRIPTLIAWPGTIKPAVADTPAITMDMYPTLLDLAGIKAKPEQHLDGRSLKSALNGAPSKELEERFLAWTYPHNHGSGHRPSHAIRKDGWKLILFDSDKTEELYNLNDDIGEKNNLADKFPAKVATMKKQLLNWIAETTPKKS